MTVTEFDPVFGNAVRSALADMVVTPRRPWYRKRRWIGLGSFVAALLLGTAGAAVAGVNILPGGTQTTALSPSVTETHSGTGTVQLGRAPAGTTNIQIDLTCLTPGAFTFDDGSGEACTVSDVGTASDSVGADIPFHGGTSTTIHTAAASRWRVSLRYVNETTTKLGTNANGQTYGVQSGSNAPDLVPVTATNGRQGYAYQKDLDWAANGNHAAPTSPAEAVQLTKENAGKTFHTPVYFSDGKTRIGTFDTGPN